MRCKISFSPQTVCSPGFRQHDCAGEYWFSLASTHAAVIYEQDFETVSSGWSVGTVTQGTVSFADGSATGAPFPTRSLELSHIPGNGTRLLSSMPNGSYLISKASTDQFAFRFDLRLSRPDVSGYVTFLDINTTSQLPMFVYINGGKFDVGYWTGSENATVTLLSGYAVDTTYTFTFTTTPRTGKFSASVKGGTGTLINGDFRRTSAGFEIFQNFNGMQIYNDGGMAGGADYDMYIDNIKIQIVPEPTVGALLLIVFGCVAVWRRR